MATRKTTYTAAEAGVIAALYPFLWASIMLAFFPFVMLNAWAAAHLWNWFPAAYLHLHPISFWMMVGIMYTFGLFKTHRHVKDEKTDWKSLFIALTLYPLIALGIGYLVHLKVS